MVSPSPRDGLRANQLILLDRRRVQAKNQFSRSRREVLKPQDGEVFMVKGFIVQQNRCRLSDSPVRTDKPETIKSVLFSRREEPTACCHYRGMRQRPGSPCP